MCPRQIYDLSVTVSDRSGSERHYVGSHIARSVNAIKENQIHTVSTAALSCCSTAIQHSGSTGDVEL